MRLWLAKAAICLLAWWAALALAMQWTGVHPHRLLVTISLFVLVKLIVTATLRSFDELWAHTSLEDLVVMVGGSVLSMGLLAVGLALAPWIAPPKLAVADGVLTLALVAPLRIAPRIYYELVRPRLMLRRSRGVVLAGRAELVDLELRRMRRQPAANRPEHIAGLVLEGPPLDGARLHRVRVLSRRDLGRLLERKLVSEISMVPPTSAEFARELSELCREHGVRCRSAASLLALSELCTSSEQLLDRPPVAGDDAPLAVAVAERCALVTGAGGSIGRELALQLLRLGVRKLVLVNRGENALFQTERVLAAANEGPCEIVSNVLDARSEAGMERLFARHRPDVVFHAAAHKHVPMMERHPAEAVLNNVGGMRVVADVADGFGVDSFVFVSTDKAVHPTSVMGATKRLGELYVRALSTASRSRLMSVRFGNVLGSNGSVLPLFIEQVQRGGPVTVTHADMSRYFMSIPEACRLVLRAAAEGRNGELFVLDMGKPMRILELASRVIERAGLRPYEDVPIIFCGPRPGEKLAEQLMFATELPRATATGGVWSVEVELRPLDELRAQLDALVELAAGGDDLAVRGRLAQLMSDFRGAVDGDDVGVDEPTQRTAPALAVG